jgi:hypothetical protein
MLSSRWRPSRHCREADRFLNALLTGNRWSHVQNTDAMDVTAEFEGEDGTSYRATIRQAMPRHPLGKYTTWFGVVYWHGMHGNTGIGTASLPKVKPEIALWGWAEVSTNGAPLERKVPAHVMVMTEGPMPGVMLELASEEKNLPGVPDGYMTIMWPHVTSIQMPTRQVYIRQTMGWTALAAVVLLFGWLTFLERPSRLAGRTRN